MVIQGCFLEPQLATAFNLSTETDEIFFLSDFQKYADNQKILLSIVHVFMWGINWICGKNQVHFRVTYSTQAPSPSTPSICIGAWAACRIAKQENLHKLFVFAPNNLKGKSPKYISSGKNSITSFLHDFVSVPRWCNNCHPQQLVWVWSAQERWWLGGGIWRHTRDLPVCLQLVSGRVGG